MHSEFSLIDGLVRIKPLVKQVADSGMPAVAISDQCNFYGLVKFYKAAQQAGVKAILGADLLLREGAETEFPYTLCLLACDQQGHPTSQLRAYGELAPVQVVQVGE